MKRLFLLLSLLGILMLVAIAVAVTPTATNATLTIQSPQSSESVVQSIQSWKEVAIDVDMNNLEEYLDYQPNHTLRITITDLDTNKSYSANLVRDVN